MGKVAIVLISSILLTGAAVVISFQFYPETNIAILGLLTFLAVTCIGHFAAYLLRRMVRERELHLIDYVYLTAALGGITINLALLDSQYMSGWAQNLRSWQPDSLASLQKNIKSGAEWSCRFDDSDIVESQYAGQICMWYRTAQTVIDRDTNSDSWISFVDSSLQTCLINSGSVLSTMNEMRWYCQYHAKLVDYERRAANVELGVAKVIGFYAIVIALALRILKTTILYRRWYRENDG